MISCRQIALADLILVNKVDLVSHAEIKALKDKIRSCTNTHADQMLLWLNLCYRAQSFNIVQLPLNQHCMNMTESVYNWLCRSINSLSQVVETVRSRYNLLAKMCFVVSLVTEFAIMSSYRIELSLILDLHAYDTASGRFVTNPGLHTVLVHNAAQLTFSQNGSRDHIFTLPLRGKQSPS